MVDRGFSTYDLSFHRHVILYIHAFMKKKQLQFLPMEKSVTFTGACANEIIPNV
jgi:hypothetical protein